MPVKEEFERAVQQHVLRRLPLAESVLLLFSHVPDEGSPGELVVDPRAVVEAFTPAPDAEQVRQRLGELLGGLWRNRWLKAPKQAVHRKTRTTAYPKKGYNNVWKALEAERRKAKRMKRHAQRHAKLPT